MQTAIYRAQHDALRKLVATLPPDDAATVDEAAAQAILAKLAGTVTMHLKLEDEKLYPRLLAHSDPQVREKAKRYQDEMGGLSAAYLAFHEKWMRRHAIEEDPRGFLAALHGIKAALAKRMDDEDGDLYVMVDKYVVLGRSA